MNETKTPYCIISWNVDCYNDIIHSWIKQLVQSNRPDVIFFSETKSTYDKLKSYFDELTEYNFIINVHDPVRYHGVAVLIRKDHTFTQFAIDLKIQARNDTKDGNPVTGRIISFQLNDHYIIVGTYVPNSGIRDDKVTKLPYRINIWDPALQSLLNICRTIKPTIWIGDINVAPEDIDVSNPKTMSKMAGFRPEERLSFSKFMETGWVDPWRSQHPDTREYSWRGNSPKPGYGLRLDNIIVSSDIASNVLNTFMIPNCIPNSDHIPIGAYINRY